MWRAKNIQTHSQKKKRDRKKKGRLKEAEKWELRNTTEYLNGVVMVVIPARVHFVGLVK